MRILFGMALTILCCLMAVASHAAADDPAVRKLLVKNYALFTVAFQHKDSEAQSRLLTDDYTAVGPDGTVTTKKQVLADMKGQMAMLRDVTWVRTITKLDVTDGKTAVATVEGHLTGTTSGKDGKDHKLELLATTGDTWILVGTDWKLKHSRVSKFRMTFDGKPAGGH